MNSLKNIKIRFIKKINECNDQTLLLNIESILDKNSLYNSVSEPESIYGIERSPTKKGVENDFRREEAIILPQSTLEILKISEKQIKNGKFFTEEEMDKMDEEWLSEK